MVIWRINPLLRTAPTLNQVTSIHTIVSDYLDLTLSSDQLFANLHTNRKRQLRNWDETLSGLVLDKPAVRDFFINNYSNFIRTKKHQYFYDFSDDTLSFLTSLDNGLVIGAPDAKQLEAVWSFLHSGCGGILYQCVIARRTPSRRPSVMVRCELSKIPPYSRV